MRTLLFDMDGTLYEDPRVYEIHVKQLASRMDESERARFLEEWRRVKDGGSVIRIGMGYDAERDLLFRHAGDRITQYVDWTGHEEPVLPPSHEHDGDEPIPPTETEAFGPGRFNLGDWWGIAGTLAVHHGLDRDRLIASFMATRAIQDRPEFDLEIDHDLIGTIRRLRASGRTLIAMSNSPLIAVDYTLEKLGIHDCFDEIVGEAGKPAGLAEFLAGAGAPEQILCVGDNYFNDIRPALRNGSYGLYIDRHRARLGHTSKRCYRVPSIRAMSRWMEEHLLR